MYRYAGGTLRGLMASRYRSLAVYSAALAAVTCTWLVQGLAQVEVLPAIWVIAFAIAFCLFVWQFGLPAPRIGLISMERVPQIGLLLVFSAPVAAAICGIASFIWPLVNRTYSQGSVKVAGLRALHNASMTALMLLCAGAAYAAAGGRHPLVDLHLSDVWPLTAMALAAQAVNIATMSAFFHLDGRDVRAVLTPAYALSDLIFVPAGVLAAVLYNSAPSIFLLLVIVMLVFVMSFSSIRDALRAAQAERSPLTRLFQAGRALHGARRIDELGERILTETRALVRFDEFYFVLVERDRQVMNVRVHERSGERLPAREKHVNAGLFGWVTASAQPLLVKDWSRAPAELRSRAEATDKETGSLIVVPLVENGAVIGLLSVQHTQAGVYSEADLHLMRQLSEQVAAAVADARAFEDLQDYRKRLEERVVERTADLEKANIEKERLIQAMRERSVRLERESQEDPLTGISNRRGFTQRLAAEMEVALAVGQPLTLAVGDLDHFKVINDRLGHTIGDKALREIATVMRAHCRHSDLVARIGGEEFALILPGMRREDGLEFCEALRATIESHDWDAVHGDLNVTLSIGLSQWDGSADVAELLQAADTQLYRAKRAGRNQVA
jgi:diguanylate cyclase (GGDEF)-like protein